MDKVDVETVVRLHTNEAVLEVGTDPDTGTLVEIRTPDASSIEWYGEVRLGLQPELAVALAHAILRVARRWRTTMDDLIDLIKRLRNFEGSDALGNGDFSLLYEAADALEAAREDAERYRLLRRKVRLAGGEFHILSLDPHYIAGDSATNLDAAIDDAMRKEGLGND